jgi:hypothetical protein
MSFKNANVLERCYRVYFHSNETKSCIVLCVCSADLRLADGSAPYALVRFTQDPCSPQFCRLEPAVPRAHPQRDNVSNVDPSTRSCTPFVAPSPRTAGRHSVAQPLSDRPYNAHMCLRRCKGDPTNVRHPPVTTGTAFPHPCCYPDSRRTPSPHLRTPHAGTARPHTSRHAPVGPRKQKQSFLHMAAVRDSGNKIAASAHGMGSGGLAVDAMVIECLGAPCGAFFSYLAIFLPDISLDPCELCKFFGRVLWIAPGGWVNRQRRESQIPSAGTSAQPRALPSS